MRSVALIALALVMAGPAVAQENTGEQPLVLRVKPSGYDNANTDARARQERLLKRMQESEFLFRNICIQCGGGINRPGAYAPFNPSAALREPMPKEP